MQENDKPVIVYTTFPDAASAEATARALVDGGLAACVNFWPGMVSIYRWQGRTEQAAELSMLVKTRASLAEAVMEAIKGRHPYETPALLVLPVEGGSPSYIGWLLAETAAPTLATATAVVPESR